MFDQCLYFNAGRLARLTTKICKEAYAEVNLVPAHAYLLRLVLSQPGISQKNISQVLHINKSTVTRFIDTLVQQGYLIRKNANMDNQKERQIFPTNKTLHLKNKLDKIGNDIYDKLQLSVGDPKLRRLVKSINAAANKIEDI